MEEKEKEQNEIQTRLFEFKFPTTEVMVFINGQRISEVNKISLNVSCDNSQSRGEIKLIGKDIQMIDTISLNLSPVEVTVSSTGAIFFEREKE